MLQAGRKTITNRLSVCLTCFDIYNAISVVHIFLFYKLNISSRLLSVVVHAFEHFRCLNIYDEYRRIDKCIIHYKCGCTYF
jgi:hypothetical protein